MNQVIISVFDDVLDSIFSAMLVNATWLIYQPIDLHEKNNSSFAVNDDVINDQSTAQ
jgi:hypothetical protein